MVVGHEFVGRVEKIGSNVHDVEIGELVSGEGHIVCGRCRNCLAGRRHLCKNPNCIGVNREGAFAEYLSIPVTNIWHCDTSIPMEVLSCFDPFGNAVHTTLSYDLVGEDVLITGAGPIGCMAVAVAKQAGARYVVITDVNPYRLELAARMKPTMVLDARTQKIEDALKQLDMKEGFDVGLEMSGHPEAFKDMLANICHGGKISLLGIMPQTAIDWDYVVFNGLTIKGIYGREMFETWYKATMLIKGGVDLKPLITHRFNYRDFEKAFEVMRSGESGKVILNWVEE
jgi:threonine 3-dehydrogenase